MSADQIQRDLGIKLSLEIETLMQRHLDIAGAILPVEKVAMMMLNTALGINASVASAILQKAKPEADRGEMFDMIAAKIASSIVAHKAKVLDGVELIRSGREAEARAKYGAERAR